MPLVAWWLLGGLFVGGGTGYVLGLETSKLLKLAAAAAVLYLLWKSGKFN